MGAAASTELADAIGAAPGGMGASHALRKGGNARASAKVQPVWDEGEDEAIERKARQLEQLKDRVNAAIASGSRVKQLLEDEVRRDLGLSAIRLRFTANGALEHCSLFSEPGGRHGCNQDSMIAWEDFNVPEIAGRTRGRMPPGAASDVIFCAVFDGHGPNGHLVSQRVRDSLPSRIASLLAPPPVATVSPYGHLDKSAPPMAPASDQLLQRLGVNGGSSKSKGASGKVHPLGLAPGYGGGGDGGIGGFGKTLHRSRSANSLDNSAPRGSVSPYHSSSSSASSASAAAAAAAAEASKEASKAQVERAFRRAFLEMDDELRSHPHVDGHVSGSTAVVAALLGRRLVVASIGDSRAVLAYRCKAGHAAPGTAPAINGMQCKPLTNDHKCSVASERKRIEQAGGRVQASEHEPWTPRIWLPRERSPGLVPSRAFGDFVVKDYGVIAEPDILIRHLTSEDEFIILASDGLWDVMTPQEAMSAVLAAPTRQTAARHLISHARSLWAAKHQSVRPDDCTAVVLFLPEFAPSGLLSGSALPHSGPLSSTPLSGPLSSSTPYSGPLSSIPHSAPLSSFHSPGPQGYSLLQQQQQQPSWQQKPYHQPQQVQLPPRQFLSQLPMPLPNLTSSDIKPVIPIPGSQRRFPEQRGSGLAPVGSGSENTWDGGAGDGAGGGSGGGRRKKSSRRKSGRREAGLMSFMGAVEEGNEEAFDDTASIASIGTVCTDASFGTVIYSEADFKPSQTAAAGVGNPTVVLTPPVCEDGFYRDDTIRVPVERQVERGTERQTESREKENMGNGDGVRSVLGNMGQGVSSSSTSDSDVERPRWAELLRSGVAIFDLDYDAIISAMYALSDSAEGDCYRCVPPNPGIAAAALGASASGTPPCTAPAEALHTFTLDYGASRCFFRDSTILTPLHAPVPVRLADPSRDLVVSRSSTVLPCPAVPSGSLPGLHLPSFSTNLRVSICTCIRMGPHLATFTRRLGSSLYMLATEPPQVAASAQVPASGQVAASCSCRLLSHQTLLWHHRLGHPSLPRLRCMHSRLLVSGLPRSLPPLPPSPAPPCLPCVEGRQRATPHSSSFPPTTAPLQTLHMDVWGPARVSGQGRERYFMLVVDDYTRYTTVFPLRGKGEVSTVLIPWIRTVHLQLRERFDQDLRVLRLHSDRGGEFSSDLLRDFCRGEGILQSFTLSDSPQQNGIDECRIGLVMEGSCAFVRDTSTDKLSTRAIPCVFLGFVPDAPGWKFYHPTSRRVLPSQDVTFNESVPFYHLFPYLSALPPPPLLFLAPGPPLVDPLPPQGPAPSDVSQVDPLPGTARVEVAVDSGAARGAASGGAVSGGAASGSR
ncbi:unnamed protein product [Closterium sp. NIES-53]